MTFNPSWLKKNIAEEPQSREVLLQNLNTSKHVPVLAGLCSPFGVKHSLIQIISSTPLRVHRSSGEANPQKCKGLGWTWTGIFAYIGLVEEGAKCIDSILWNKSSLFHISFSRLLLTRSPSQGSSSKHLPACARTHIDTIKQAKRPAKCCAKRGRG